jgi:hypothetical protein
VWLDFDLSRNGYLAWFYFGYFNMGRHHLLAPAVFSFPVWLFELFDYTAVLFENSGFIWLLLGRRPWRMWLLVAAGFHLTNTLLLNIPFDVHLPVLLAFTDLSRAETVMAAWLRSTKDAVAASLVLVAVLISGVLSEWRPIWSLLAGSDPDSYSRTELYASVVLWSIGILVLGWNVVTTRSRGVRLREWGSGDESSMPRADAIAR